MRLRPEHAALAGGLFLLSGCLHVSGQHQLPFWAAGDWSESGDPPRAVAAEAVAETWDGLDPGDPLAAYAQADDVGSGFDFFGGFSNILGLQSAIGDDLRYLPIINSSSTRVICRYRRGDGATFETVIPAGHRAKLYPGEPKDMGAPEINGLKLSCPLVGDGKIYSGLQRGQRYVIQRAADGGLELVVVVAQAS